MGIRREITVFPKLNFTQFVNGNVKILCRRFYSRSLKDVPWLKDAALLIFLMFHTFVGKFGSRGSRVKN